MNLIKTGKIIADARKNKNMTQKELANKLHISDKAISKWERGLGYPDISLLIPLTNILDITLYEILIGEKEEVEETLKRTITYSNNEIRRKKREHKRKTFLITSIIILLFFMFGYKLFNLFFYNVNVTSNEEYIKFIEGYQIKDVEEIKTKKLDEKEYITYKDVKIKNIFDNYKCVFESDDCIDEDGFMKYFNEEGDKYFSVGISNRFIDYIDKEMDAFGLPSVVYESINKTNVLSHIKSDLELFNYFYENRNRSVNIFSSIKEIKDNYYIKNLSYTILPLSNYITELKGDLNGYIINYGDDFGKDIREISIDYNNKRFVIFMIGYNKEEVLEIINTLIIEK